MKWRRVLFICFFGSIILWQNQEGLNEKIRLGSWRVAIETGRNIQQFSAHAQKTGMDAKQIEAISGLVTNIQQSTDHNNAYLLAEIYEQNDIIACLVILLVILEELGWLKIILEGWWSKESGCKVSSVGQDKNDNA